MSSLARRARSLSLLNLAGLRLATAAGLDACGGLLPPTPPVGVPPAAGAAARLWPYDSPLLRHLSSVAAHDVSFGAGPCVGMIARCADCPDAPPCNLRCPPSCCSPRGPCIHACSSLQASHGAAAAAAAGPGPVSLPPYEQLRARAAAAAGGEGPLALAPSEQRRINRLLRAFQLSGAVKGQALALYVNSKVLSKAAAGLELRAARLCALKAFLQCAAWLRVRSQDRLP